MENDTHTERMIKVSLNEARNNYSHRLASAIRDLTQEMNRVDAGHCPDVHLVGNLSTSLGVPASALSDVQAKAETARELSNELAMRDQRRTWKDWDALMGTKIIDADAFYGMPEDHTYTGAEFLAKLPECTCEF